MKKFFKILICALLVIAFAALAACKAKDPKPVDTNTPAPAKEYSADELAKAIFDNVPFEDEYLTAVEDREFAMKFYGIDPALVAEKDGVKQIAVYTSGSYPEMIVCVKAVDEASADKVLEPIRKLIETYINNYTNYGPEQISKLETAVVVKDGANVTVAVTNDNSAASSFIKDYIGK
ncbi:MAG: DUF4358 domain-containing protein [Clostridia bacterium]|nr:DUF4358 domain-containing protein [Clostridia bacterium]